ncbi:unnamed protein product, partial [Soboliphyme baturini]|uniref:AMP-binding domain-containing protein n=1 Tax=Soboliphyme baturini TaxID=241478 RepID=A0A183IA81_9BILA
VLSGDILYFDDHAYLYFKDRIGDTFRWKGENVSTNEVEGIVQRISGLTDATVYGVEIVGSEGRAGMLAIVDVKKTINIEGFYSLLCNYLPRYAVPIFIRFCQEVETTGKSSGIKLFSLTFVHYLSLPVASLI